MAGNDRGEGRSWVDQGLRYSDLGRFERAIAAHKKALSSLPQDELRHRFTAHQCLADLYLRQGNPHQALEQVGRAEELAPGVGKGLRGSLTWTKAEIAIAGSDYEQAEQCYAEALGIFRTVSPIDAALAAVELVQTQIRQGKLDSAREATMAMSSLLGPLQKNRVVSAALMRLMRLVLGGGQVTYRMLDLTAGEIKKERARLERRARCQT